MPPCSTTKTRRRSPGGAVTYTGVVERADAGELARSQDAAEALDAAGRRGGRRRRRPAPSSRLSSTAHAPSARAAAARVDASAKRVTGHEDATAAPVLAASRPRRTTTRRPAMSAALVVMAKEPLPGRVKTRLCPPLDARAGRALAEAALADTLDAVAWTPARRRVLVLDGAPGPWLPPRASRSSRSAATASPSGSPTRRRDVGEPLVFLGMDTPQLTRALLCDALDRLATARRGARADDRRRLLDDRPARARPDAPSTTSPMSTAGTAASQRARLDRARPADGRARPAARRRHVRRRDRRRRPRAVDALRGDASSSSQADEPRRGRLPARRDAHAGREVQPADRRARSPRRRAAAAR